MFILSREDEISFTCKSNSFSYECLCTRPRFDRGVEGNSGMGYQINEKRSIHRSHGEPKYLVMTQSPAPSSLDG